MFRFTVNLVRWQSGLACAVWLGLSASAQQVIQFSKPADSDPAQKANNFMPDHGNRNPDSFNAPSSLFANQVPSDNFEDVAGNSANLAAAAAAAQWQKLQERNKNWGLMTPEEILGIPTPEKLLGITEDDKDAKLSPEERFLKHQDQLAATSASNNLHSADLSIWHNDTADGRGVFQGVEAANRTKLLNQSVPGTPPILNRFSAMARPTHPSCPSRPMPLGPARLLYQQLCPSRRRSNSPGWIGFAPTWSRRCRTKRRRRQTLPLPGRRRIQTWTHCRK